MKIKVAYVTTARSDYGPSYWLIHDLFADKRFEMNLLVGGSHLSPYHGNTIREIEAHGWPRITRVPFLGRLGDLRALGRDAGRALIEFSNIFEQQRPDIVILYGDRYELLPIATAAVIHRIPIAHICGGDITEGAFDDQVRHAVTKLAHLHFPSTKNSAERLLQMGEETWRIHMAGDPALDHFTRGQHASADELATVLGFIPDANTLLVTYHPVTLEPEKTPLEVRELAIALNAFKGPIVITGPSPDPGGESIRREFLKLQKKRKQTAFVESLGSFRYRGLLSLVGAVVGNSSSGLIEAATVPVPVVNIGNRQSGRERGANVIDVEATQQKIQKGIARALSPLFRRSLAGMKNSYGDGEATGRILAALAKMPTQQKLLNKHWVPSC
ncbi:MAG: UDP-N-acetylglucosamine 2-epimerase [bacterium]